MTKETDARADRPGVAREVAAEDDGLARTEIGNARRKTKQRGLAGTVRTSHEDDLTGGHVEIDPGQRGEAPKQRDRRAKVDDGVHETCSP